MAGTGKAVDRGIIRVKIYDGGKLSLLLQNYIQIGEVLVAMGKLSSTFAELNHGTVDWCHDK